MDCPTTVHILVALIGLHGLMGGGGIAGDGNDGDRLGRGCGALEELEGEMVGPYALHMLYTCIELPKNNKK